MRNLQAIPDEWLAESKYFPDDAEDHSEFWIKHDRLFMVAEFALAHTVCATQVQLMANGWSYERAEAFAKCEYFARELILHHGDTSHAYYAYVDYKRIASGELRLIAPPPSKRRVVFSGPLSEMDPLARDDWDMTP